MRAHCDASARASLCGGGHIVETPFGPQGRPHDSMDDAKDVAEDSVDEEKDADAEEEADGEADEKGIEIVSSEVGDPLNISAELSDLRAAICEL